MVLLAAVIAVVVVLVTPVGCSSDEEPTGAAGDVPTTAPSAAPSAALPAEGAPTTLAPTSGLVSRLADVDSGNLVLGARFNRQFVTMQFLAVGFDATESECLAGVVASQQGSEFAQRRVREVFSGAGMTPEAMSPCVTLERLTALASSGAAPDLGRVPTGVVRSSFTGLAAAGFESAGLTAVESSCLADEVLDRYSDEQLAALGTEALGATTQFDDSAVASAIPDCVDGDRIAELNR